MPQEELLFHVVAQQNSKDAVHSILDIKRQHLQPSSLVEEALVRLGMMAMEVQEKSVSTQTFSTFEVWSHFASQLVYFHFLQLINITSLLTKLRSKVSRRGVVSPFHLTWSCVCSSPALSFVKDVIG